MPLYIDNDGNTFLPSKLSKDDFNLVKSSIEEALDSSGLVLISRSGNATEHRMKVDDFIRSFLKEIRNES